MTTFQRRQVALVGSACLLKPHTGALRAIQWNA